MTRRRTAIALPLSAMLLAVWAMTAALFAGDVASSAADSAVEPKFTDEAQRAADERRRSIERELAGDRNESWQGSYYAGDGLGVNQTMLVARDAGFVFEWHGCLGLYDRNYGTVVGDSDRIRLVPEFVNDQEGFQGISEELLWVRWGKRSYLVPADDVQEFCNDVNSGLEPRRGEHGSALLRDGDWKKRATGRPELPADVASCLLAQPIEPRVVSIDSSTVRVDSIGTRWVRVEVTIDHGRNDGVGLGMMLSRRDRAGLFGYVVAVAETTATVRFEEMEKYAGGNRLEAGTRLTSRAFD